MTIFESSANSSECLARTGQLKLAHGSVDTPAFMPVGTSATVKAVELDALDKMGYSLILSNTYHLMLRPGKETIEMHGGLHKFMQWSGNILTDSGGFQVFSLAPFRKVKKEGVKFQSHIDGSMHFLSPERAVELQCSFNSDIQMVLDVCTAKGVTEKKALEAVYITSDWARRAHQTWLGKVSQGYQGALFGIVQGNFFKELRQRSAEEICALDFPGFAIGGLSVGETFEEFSDFLSFTSPLLPASKPRYLMGIGTPEYILQAVEYGIDMFDCVFPTRIARNGTLFTKNGRLVIKNERYKNDLRPVEEQGPLSRYSRSYLRHLFKSQEILGPILASQHNLYFLKNMMTEIRQAIVTDRFKNYKKNFLSAYQEGIAP